nr:MAG TPA: Replicase large subunit [Bacteriophage sp.]
MTECLGVTADRFFNNKKIKIFDGKGGTAKSTNVTKMFNYYRKIFGRYTSTHKLRRDALDRFGGFCYTIAGGLFNTKDGIFFDSEKPPEFESVVIDEILQTDSRVLDWVDRNVGKVNIIICTDTRQMLSQHSGEAFLARFLEFCKRPDVIYTKLDYSYRPVNERTRKVYDFCYDQVETDYPVYKQYKKLLPNISFQEMPFSRDNVYLCHTNDIEEYLYSEFHIEKRYDLDLIPKGNIAGREDIKDPSRYPILPQKKVGNKNIGYFQPSNIGTVTRYQGSEVQQGHKLYFIVEDFSKVENREFYTMITRCKDVDDVVIVTCDVPRDLGLDTFNGKKVKSKAIFHVDGSHELPNGQTVAEYSEAADGKRIEMNQMYISSIEDKIHDTPETHYTGIMYDGRMIVKPSDEECKRKVTMYSLLNKEPELGCQHMGEFMRTFEKVQRSRFRGADAPVDMVRGPLNMDWHSVFIRENATEPEYKYGIDLYASYPHCIYNGKMPDGRKFYPVTEQVNPFHTELETGMVDFYMMWTMEHGDLGTVCTGELVKYMQNLDKHFHAYYLGSSPILADTRLGNYLMGEAYKTYESKKRLKNIHYGFLQKPYLEPIYEHGKLVAYFTNPERTYELLMCAIQSEQALQLQKLRYSIYGDLFHGHQHVDCLYFDTDEDIQELGDRLKAVVQGYDFRIFQNVTDGKTSEKPVLYKTYKDLKTVAQLKNERRRKKQA